MSNVPHVSVFFAILIVMTRFVPPVVYSSGGGRAPGIYPAGENREERS